MRNIFLLIMFIFILSTSTKTNALKYILNPKPYQSQPFFHSSVNRSRSRATCSSLSFLKLHRVHRPPSRHNFKPLSTTSISEEKIQQPTCFSRSLGITNYEPKTFEADIYRWWESTNSFVPSTTPSPTSARTTSTSTTINSSPPSNKKPFVVPMPPPNVTGRLHLGHALFVSLQDVLVRFHRMRGRPTLWLPGTDHAGIATQMQVEKILLSEGSSREKIGREKFMERMWEYKNSQGSQITKQLRALGASCDWSRERFTMDEGMSNSVTEAFIRLHEKGLIYKGEYIVNWSTSLKTAVSDLEVDYCDEIGKLYFIKYIVPNTIDGSGGGGVDGATMDDYITVATTRPETIFGDTALCVHPDDVRYKHFIGKCAIVPLSGGRTIPIICDREAVDPSFGSGVLKITPGHDVKDYATGKRHSLEIRNIMNKDGTLNGNVSAKYQGLDRIEARKIIWADMITNGLSIKMDDVLQRIPRSQRGGDIIEPMVSSQWFVKTEGMGKKALDAVHKGDIKILPHRFEKIWDNWLEGIHDWCISRQLWWGHRIPVYYLDSSKTEYVVARSLEEAISKAKALGKFDSVKDQSSILLHHDEDVLDTWFSSGLWPFATLGWPKQDNDGPESDLARFYPATCLETGYDILFFWVARMVMMGIELTGKPPFECVYLHGLVRAADGTKMSKTKGNVIDPLETVSKFGADSLRFSLLTGVTPGQDVPLNIEKIEASRNFVNKLWNCCKFVVDNALKESKGTVEFDEQYGVEKVMTTEEFNSLNMPEKWIVRKCHKLVEEVTYDLENYRIAEGGRKVYEFIWDDFCDWYIEISKTRLYEVNGGGNNDPKASQRAKRVLVYVLDRSLHTLHPFMPFATEKLWHHIPQHGFQNNKIARSLMLERWPQTEGDTLCNDLFCENEFSSFQSLVKGIRNARAEYNVEQGKKIAANIFLNEELLASFKSEVKALSLLAKLGDVSLYDSSSSEGRKRLSQKEGFIHLVIQNGIDVLLPLQGMMDLEKERDRLKRQEDKLKKDIDKLLIRMNTNGFAERAPRNVFEKTKTELESLRMQVDKINQSLKAL